MPSHHDYGIDAEHFFGGTPDDEPAPAASPRFVPVVDNPEFPIEDDTCWWWDTHRKATGGQPYIAVQTYRDKNPNDCVRHAQLYLLFTDRVEYYAVCLGCRYRHAHQQWTGSTRGGSNWRERADKFLEKHTAEKGWCEFCDPVFGNGGWRL